MVSFNCKTVNNVSTIDTAFLNFVSVEIDVNSIERSKSQTRIAFRMFVSVFLVLFMVTPVLSEVENVSELIAKYGKDDLVTFIQRHRDGYFTVEWLSDGKLRNFSEEIDNRYITVKSIKKDLEIIGVTASDVNRQMSQTVPSKKQVREAEEITFSGHKEEEVLINYRKYKERIEGLSGQQIPDEWIFEKMDRSKFDPATLPPPHKYTIEDLIEEAPTAKPLYIREGLKQYNENIQDGIPEPYQRTTALEFERMGRERVNSKNNYEFGGFLALLIIFVFVFLSYLFLSQVFSRKRRTSIPYQNDDLSNDTSPDLNNENYNIYKDEVLEAGSYKSHHSGEIVSAEHEKDYDNENNRKAFIEKQISQINKKGTLTECSSCKQSISARVNICPKCGEEQAKECLICNNLIPSQSSNCPECGDPSPFSTQENNQVKEEYILEQHGDNNTVKSILIAIPCVIFIALFVSAVNDLMDPGFLRLVIILLAFYLTFKSWEWLKNRFS